MHGDGIIILLAIAGALILFGSGLVLGIINLVWNIKLNRRVRDLERNQTGVPVTQPVISPRPTVQPVPPPAGKKTEPKAQPRESWESKIGGGCLARIGVLAMVIGTGFFLKYAIDNDWIGEVTRVVIGIGLGLLALVSGDQLHRRNYSRTGLSLTGGGIAILYFSVFAAYSYYHLISQFPAFLFLAMVTLMAVLLAVRYDSRTIILLGLAAGFLTPIILSTGENKLFGLCAYMLVLDLGFLGLAHFKDWKWLNLLALLGTSLLFLGWIDAHYDKTQMVPALLAATMFFILFAVLAVYYNLVHRQPARRLDLVVLSLNALIYFFFGLGMIEHGNKQWTGAFTLVVAAIYLAFTAAVRRRNPDDLKLARSIAGLAIVFLTLVFPMQFDGAPVTLSWIIESAVICYLGLCLRSVRLRLAAGIIFLISAGQLISYGSAIVYRDGQPWFHLLMNPRFGLALLLFIAGYGIVYSYRKFTAAVSAAESCRVSGVLLLAVHFFALWALSAESSDWFSFQRQILPAEKQQREVSAKINDAHRRKYQYQTELNPAGTGANQPNQAADVSDRLAYQIQAIDQELAILQQEQNELSQKKWPAYEKLRYSQQLSYSLIWSVYSVLMIIFGIVSRQSVIRIFAIMVFAVTIGKVFFIDLSGLRTIYRIVSFMVLGLILISVSLLYTRFKTTINGFMLAEGKDNAGKQ